MKSKHKLMKRIFESQGMQVDFDSFGESVEESIDEMIERIINETESRLLSEGRLDEGLMQSVFKFGKKVGLDKLALIAIMTYGANSPMAKNFVEDLESQIGDKVEDVQQAASEMASSLKSKGIKLTKSPEGDPVFDHGETTPAEDSDAVMAAFKRDNFDKNLKKVGDNIYHGENKGFIFGTKVQSTSVPAHHAAKEKIEKLAAEKGAKVSGHTMKLTMLDDGWYATMSTRYAN